jgi:uncharacterized protein (DUF2062 family)
VPRKFFRKYLPDPEAVLAKPWAAPLRPWLGHPNLWHLNRRSVPGAIAIGLFCGLIPGPVQMLFALLFAIPARCNIPVAMAVTLYTNPFTIVPLYLLAYGYGRLILGEGGPDAYVIAFEWEWSAHALWQWMLLLGKPLGIGLVALALTLAVLGYFVAELVWRVYIVTAWRRRRARRRSAGGRAPP